VVPCILSVGERQKSTGKEKRKERRGGGEGETYGSKQWGGVCGFVCFRRGIFDKREKGKRLTEALEGAKPCVCGKSRNNQN